MKDWNDISDEEFDSAFKDISLNHSEEVWHHAWPLMEEKLEEENRKRRFIIFWRSAAAVLIFGTLGVVSTIYFKKEDIANKTANIENKNIPILDEKNQPKIAKTEILIQKSVTNQGVITNELNLVKKQVEAKAEERSNNIFAEKTVSNSTSTQLLAKNKLKSPSIQSNQIVERPIPNDILISQKSSKETQTTPKPEIQQTEDKTEVAVTEKTKEKTEITETKEIAILKTERQTQDAYFKEDTVIIVTNRSNPIINQSTSSESSAALATKNTKVFQKLAISFGFSPDYSKVVASDFGTMGYNMQAILDYKISNRWALRTGVIRSLKLYSASPEDYAWPTKWGKPSSPLKEISATCDMIDIPVSLSYQVLEKGSNKLYTSLGITNYKMMNEKYEYFYENDADPNLKWRKWEGSSGFFGAGIVNISVGLERKLTNFLSVQVEPFVKIPVKNVGFGNVKLLTTGLFMNVKTHAPRKKIQPK